MIEIINKIETKEESDLKLQCACMSEILHISRILGWLEWDICIWYRGFNPRSLWDRIKFCLKFLYTGELYSDQIILNREQIKELRNFLTRELNRTKNINE